MHQSRSHLLPTGAGEPHAGQQARDGHSVGAGRNEEPQGAPPWGSVLRPAALGFSVRVLCRCCRRRRCPCRCVAVLLPAPCACAPWQMLPVPAFPPCTPHLATPATCTARNTRARDAALRPTHPLQARHEQVNTEAALAALKRSAQQEVVDLDAEDEEAVRQARAHLLWVCTALAWALNCCGSGWRRAC